MAGRPYPLFQAARHRHGLSCGWQLMHVAVSGDAVLNERVDVFLHKEGGSIIRPVMGTVTVVGNLITVWRDYFDLASFEQQLALVRETHAAQASGGGCCSRRGWQAVEEGELGTDDCMDAGRVVDEGCGERRPKTGNAVGVDEDLPEKRRRHVGCEI